MRRVQGFRLRHLAQTRLWLVPLTCVLAGIGLAVALLSVDRPLVGTAVTGSAASVQLQSAGACGQADALHRYRFAPFGGRLRLR